MKIKLLLLASLLLAGPAGYSADRVTAILTITNAPTTNGMGFVVNGSLRTWTNNVFNAAEQILTNNSVNGIATNLYLHLLATPPTGIAVTMTDTNKLRLDAQTGTALILGVTNYYEAIYSTQTVSAAYDVAVPYTATPSTRRQTITEGLVDWLNLAANNNAIDQTKKVAEQLVGLANNQTVTGNKTFTGILLVTNREAIFILGIVSATNFTGIINMISNGVWWNGSLSSPSLTNGQNFGSPFRSPGSAPGSEQFGTSATATGTNSTAMGYSTSASGYGAQALGSGTTATGDYSVASGGNAIASGFSSSAVGAFAVATKTNATALGRGARADEVGSTAIGTGANTTTTNQVRLGTESDHVSIPGVLRSFTADQTNNFPAGSDIAFGRFAVTSLANGNNAAVPVGTNVLVEVSGPSADFTVNGINADGATRDGKLLIIVNQTGFNMTIAHQSGTDPTAANRIITMTGADRVTTGNGTATFMYFSSVSRWILVAFDP